MHQETTEVLSDESKNKLPLFSNLSPSTQNDNKKKPHTQHTDSHMRYAALAEVGSVSARFWLWCDGTDWESEKSASKFKLLITVKHLNTADSGKRLYLSLTSILRQYRSANLISMAASEPHRMPHALGNVTKARPTLWVSPYPWHLSIWLHLYFFSEYRWSHLMEPAQIGEKLGLAVYDWVADGAEP